MKFNYILTLLLSSCFLILSSCGSDDDVDDCTGQSLSSLIMGEWTADGSKVNFNNGTIIDDGRVLLEPNIPDSEISTKSYTILAGELTITVLTTAGGSTAISYTGTIVNCDEIGLEWVSGTSTIKLTR